MTASGFHMARNADEFSTLSAAVTRVIDPAARLPSLPFRSEGGRVAVGEFTRLLGTDFVPVFRALADTYGDETLNVLVVEPSVSYFSDGFGFFPAFTVAVEEVEDGYWNGLAFSPSYDPTGEMRESADVIAVVGATQEWAIWGQRSWELVLVWAPTIGGWADVGVPLVSPQRALEDFAGYGSWGTRLDPDHVSAFIRNVEALT